MPPKSSAAADKGEKPAPAAFAKDEKTLCFHGPFLYEAKVLDVAREKDSKESKGAWKYLVHYKGWKNTWDDWVSEDRVRKFSDENKALASDLVKDARESARQERAAKDAKKSTTNGTIDLKRGKAGRASELGSVRASEDRSSAGAQAAAPRGVKRARDWENIEKEETFLHRPSIRIPIPDHLKGLLVDDWENVTKSLQLLPLPHPHPVTAILAAYTAFEAPRRRPGSADADILEEVVQGVREYFDKSLGRILLYRFERQQWLEVRGKMLADPETNGSTGATVDSDGDVDVDVENNGNSNDSQTVSDSKRALAGKTPSQIYGAEHLCRLFVSMPELIAQTNMDAQSVARLREELVKMTSWLGKNAAKFFAKAYVDPGVAYVEKSKGTG